MVSTGPMGAAIAPTKVGSNVVCPEAASVEKPSIRCKPSKLGPHRKLGKLKYWPLSRTSQESRQSHARFLSPQASVVSLSYKPTPGCPGPDWGVVKLIALAFPWPT